MTMPNGKGPLLIGAALAVGAWYYMSRKSAGGAGSVKANLATRRQLQDPGRIDRTQSYANPQAMAELLARTVVGITNNITATLPKTVTDAVGTADALAAIRNSETPGYYGWSGPVVSAVDPSVSSVYSSDPYHGGDMVDGTPVAPVYDVTTDTQINPWVYQG
jgi:hypothetical protein